VTERSSCGRIGGKQRLAVAKQEMGFPPIIVITGPTAVGKSAVALKLAPHFGAEIVSVDSRQVYRFLDVGTAKPSLEDRSAVLHHLIDLVDPDNPYSAADYRADADAILVDIKHRGSVAFLVGGTGHYLQAVLERLEIPQVPPQEEFRREMESFARSHGAEALHARLRAVDPGADVVPATNVRRVIRALEVQMVTGVPFTEIGRKRGEPIPALRLALTTDRENLYSRIDERVEQQIRDGLIDEARRVLEMGFTPGLPPLAGLVYREAIAVAQGKMPIAAATKRMKETTHSYARRQYTWFRRDKELRWFDAGPSSLNELSNAISGYLRDL
jgi:tRNA dimethylallyltransferase